MIQRIDPRLLLPAVALLLCAQIGCSERSRSNVSKTTVTGSVTAGPVDSATVRAYRVDPSSGAAVVAAETTTNEDGAFVLGLPLPGPFLIVATDGSYVDEATGKTLSLGPSAGVTNAAAGRASMLEALIGSLESGETMPTEVHLTALSTIASRRSIALGRVDPDAYGEAQVRATSQRIGDEFGLGQVDTRSVAPLDLTAASDASQVQSGAGQPPARLGALVAAFSQAGAARGLSDPLQLLDALAQDYEDGVFNGQRSGSPVSVGGVALAPDAGDFQLAEALATFLKSSRNVSGTLSANFAELIESMVTQAETQDGVNRAPAFAPIPGEVLQALGAPEQVTVEVLLLEPGEALAATVVSSDTGVVTVGKVGVSGSSVTFDLAPVGAAGSATVTVTIQDDGGVANGGRDTSADAFDVVVSVAPVGVFDETNWDQAVWDN